RAMRRMHARVIPSSPSCPALNHRKRSLSEDPRQLDPVEVQLLLIGGDDLERRPADLVTFIADKDAVLPISERIDRGDPHPRCDEPIARCWRRTPDDMAENGHADDKTDFVFVLLEMVSDGLRIVLTAFGDDHDGVRLPAEVRGSKTTRDLIGFDLGLGNDDDFGSARNPRHEREKAMITTHRLNEVCSVMARSGGPQ